MQTSRVFDSVTTREWPLIRVSRGVFAPGLCVSNSSAVTVVTLSVQTPPEYLVNVLVDAHIPRATAVAYSGKLVSSGVEDDTMLTPDSDAGHPGMSRTLARETNSYALFICCAGLTCVTSIFVFVFFVFISFSCCDVACVSLLCRRLLSGARRTRVSRRQCSATSLRVRWACTQRGCGDRRDERRIADLEQQACVLVFHE